MERPPRESGFSDRQKGRGTHCVAGANPRAGGHPGGAGRPEKPWRSAAEVIDWSLPCPSIFDTREAIREKYGLSAQRPLRPNTMRRVIRGVDKFSIKAPDPFLVVVNHAGNFRGQDAADPLQTVTAKHGYGVASPVMAPLTMHNNENATGTKITEPVNTITSSGAGGHQMVITPAMIQYHTEQTERVRGQGLAEPLMTIDASNRYGLAAASLVKYYGSDQHGQSAGDPLHTVTAKDREGVLVANLAKFYGGAYTGEGSRMSDPLHTVTAVDHNAMTATHLVKMKGTNLGGPMSEPVQTITAGGGHFGVVTTVVAKAERDADLKHWPEIRDLLNTYCGYRLGPEDVILFEIGGTAYFMADIGLRMLTPRELYMANGFPRTTRSSGIIPGGSTQRPNRWHGAGTRFPLPSPRPWCGPTCRSGAASRSTPWRNWKRRWRYSRRKETEEITWALSGSEWEPPKWGGSARTRQGTSRSNRRPGGTRTPPADRWRSGQWTRRRWNRAGRRRCTATGTRPPISAGWWN